MEIENMAWDYVVIKTFTAPLNQLIVLVVLGSWSFSDPRGYGLPSEALGAEPH